ncbi:MAG: RimK family alpha-L-glutamate ligase [Planctomycetaceae bacterium]|nr:RimK family alpha-L-glutamate ligase [Planctomycetaceae bacterium]
MQIGVLGNRESWYVADIDRAGRERGHVTQRIDFRSLTASEGFAEMPIIQGVAGAGATIGSEAPERSQTGASLRSIPGHTELVSQCQLTDIDALIVRTMPPGSLEQVVFRMDVLARLETAGVLVVNGPKAIECAVDKYLATSKLAAEGLPVPRTIVCQDTEAAMEAFDALGGDVVVKPLFGAEGRGIVRVSDPDLAFRTFRTLERIQSVLYLQQFIEHEGYDIRVLVLDGEIIGAFKRRNTSDFRTNMARSATGEVHDLTDNERDMAVRAVRVTDATFGGVDLLYDRSGECYVLEVNAVPGWKAFARVTGIDVAAKLIEWLSLKTAAKR